MSFKTVPLLTQSCAVLCAALMLVFTQAAVASAVGEVEHLVAGHHQHQHMLFSDLTLDFDHQPTHDPNHHDADDDAVPDHAPGHHHHPGDLGSASVLVASGPPPLLDRVAMTDAPAPAQGLTKIRLPLPERPPRTGHIRL